MRIATIDASEAAKVSTGKSLSISIMLDGHPQFEFFGPWTGKDITLISGQLSRAYHKQKLAEKRAVKKEE